MANITAKTDPGYPDVYQYAESDPATGGPDGILTRPIDQLAERADHLRNRTAVLESSSQDHDTRLAVVETAGSVSVGRAFGLYAAEAADYELFADAPYIWRDITPRAVIQTVSGDESIDIDSTAGLSIGDTYVIRDDDGSTETITVSEILSAQRIRATATLTTSRTDTGTLSRTSWDIRAGHALCQDGAILYSRPIRVLRYDTSGRVLIRRDAGDGTIALAVRDAATGTTWTDCPLVSSTAAPDAGDRVDLEYTIPLGGIVEYRVTTATGPSGPSGNPIRVDHLVCLPPPDAQRDLVRRPVAVAPAIGAVDVSETPTLETRAYYSLYGVDQADLHVRIARDPLMQDIVHEGSLGAAGVQYTVPGGVLSTDGQYWWDAVHEDAEGAVSLRMEPAGFSCASTFIYVATSTISSPAEGATGVSLLPTITTSAFAVVGGDDSHSDTHIQIVAVGAGGTIDWSGTLLADLTVGAVTSHTLADPLPRDTDIAIRVRHEGTTLGSGGWSTTRRVRTSNVGDASTVTSPTAGSTITLRPAITLSAYSFPGGGEAHVSSQYRVTSADGLTVLYDSGETTDLIRHTVPSDLPGLTDVRILGRQRGGTTGWTPWSAAIACTTQAPSGEAVFTSPGTFAWTVPDGVTEVSVVCIGAGGAGSSAPDGAGGAGGGLGWANSITVLPGAAIPITVAGGGVGNGGDGGTSSFGAALSATGGRGGSGVTGGEGGAPVGHEGGGRRRRRRGRRLQFDRRWRWCRRVRRIRRQWGGGRQGWRWYRWCRWWRCR